MALLVAKFGGTSVASPERIQMVAKRLISIKQGGDDVVADEVAKAILETAHLNPREQSEKFERIKGRDYAFAWMLCSVDKWPIIDIVSRLMHDEASAREYLCDKLFRENNVDSVILCSRIRSGKFIHFQMTRASSGGMDAYIVFRTPKTRSATIIRFCYK